MVLGTHPHVIQPYFYNIFYSLGNFIFDQMYDVTKEGLIVELNIDTITGNVDIIPRKIYINDDFQPTFQSVL